MAQKFDTDLVQELLFALSADITEKISKDDKKMPTAGKLIALNLESNNFGISDEESNKITLRQAELLSFSSAPKKEIAKELFLDGVNIPGQLPEYWNNEYKVINNITLFRGDKAYKFNIEDDINSKTGSVNATIPGTVDFVVNNITITNNSKDAFTLRSNYLVKIEINFNYVNDLKKNSITARLLNNTGVSATSGSFSALNLIYPFYDTTILEPDAQLLKLYNQNIGPGIILEQQVIFHSPSHFKETSAFYSGDSLLTKNFHLTYYKHNFSFATENTNLKYTNKLTIEYIAFDSATSDKSGNFAVPSINTNVYKILEKLKSNQLVNTTKRELDAFNENTNALDIIKTFLAVDEQNIKILQQAVDCGDRLNELSSDVRERVAELADVDFSVLLDTRLNMTDEEKASKKAAQEKLRKSLADLSSKQESFIFDIKLTLAQYLIAINKYNFEISLASLINYKNGSVLNKTFSMLKSDLGTAIEVGVPVSMVASALANTRAGAVVAGSKLGRVAGATAVGLAIGAVGARTLFGGNYANGETSALSLDKLRKNFRFIDINLIKSQKEVVWIQDLQKAFDKADTEEEKQKAVNEVISKSFIRDEGEFIEKLYGVEEGDINNDSFSRKKHIKQIEFVLFGDILNSILPNGCEFILGGATQKLQFGGKFKNFYFNYYYIPIDFLAYSQFVTRKILQGEGLSYSTESFIKDLIDELIKKPLSNNGPYKSYYSAFIPANISLKSTFIRKKLTDGGAFSSQIKNQINNFNFYKIGAAADSRFDIIKEYLQKFKNIGTTNQYIKLYSFGTDNISETKNYYEASGDGVQTLESFQGYIIDTYNMPCFVVRQVPHFNSIIKKNNFTFTRKDNSNLTTAQLLDNNGFLRFPYEVKTTLSAYAFWFLDLGNPFFVINSNSFGIVDKKDIFGFNGIYFVKSVEYVHKFPIGEKSPGASEASECIIGGQLISYGDGSKADRSDTQTVKTRCSDPIKVDRNPLGGL